MVRTWILVAAVVLLAPTTAQAGVEFFAGAIASALVISAESTLALTLGTIASIAANSLIGLGLSLVQSALFGQDPSGPSPNRSPIRQAVKQATPSERYIYGRALVGYAVGFHGSAPPYLVTLHMLAAHRCDAVEAVYVKGTRCDFNANGAAITPRFRVNGVSYLDITTRLGDPDQTLDTTLSTYFPSLPSTFRQRGVTTVATAAYYGPDFDAHQDVWGTAGNFEPTFLVRGKPVYDPRDANQDVDDDTTWTWSDNWALCVADWIRSYYGGRKASDRIDWTAVATAADYCDEGVGTSSGGVEKRYTLNGGFTADQNPFEVLQDMLSAAGDSAILWRNGKAAPYVDVYREAVTTITQADVVAGWAYQNARPRGDVLNTVKSQFVYPDRAYKAAVSPPLVDAALLSSDGQTYEALVNRPFVSGEERAQRLDKLTLERSRLGRVLTTALGFEHMALEVGDIVNVEFDDFPSVNGTYQIREMSFDGLLQHFEVVLHEAADANLFLWDASTEVQSTALIDVIDEAA